MEQRPAQLRYLILLSRQGCSDSLPERDKRTGRLSRVEEDHLVLDQLEPAGSKIDLLNFYTGNYPHHPLYRSSDSAWICGCWFIFTVLIFCWTSSCVYHCVLSSLLDKRAEEIEKRGKKFNSFGDRSKRCKIICGKFGAYLKLEMLGSSVKGPQKRPSPMFPGDLGNLRDIINTL